MKTILTRSLFSRVTDLVAPSEALSINSRPLLALRAALREGEIARVLRSPVSQIPPGKRQMKQVTSLAVTTSWLTTAQDPASTSSAANMGTPLHRVTAPRSSGRRDETHDHGR